MQRLLPLFALLFAVSAWGQAPKFEWVRPIPSGDSADNPEAEYYDFRVDPAGNSYLYGVLSGKTDFGNNVVLQPPQPGDEMFFLAKFDPQGQPLWARPITAPTGEPNISLYMNAPGLELDAQGSIYLSGTMNTTLLDFGNGVQLELICPDDCAHAFIAKYSPEGKALWAKKIMGGNTFGTSGDKLAIGGDFLYLTGAFNGPTLDFGDGLVYSGQKPGLFLAKMRVSDGKALWATFIKSNNPTFLFSTQLTRIPSGDLWMSGVYISALDFGNGLLLPTYQNGNGEEYFVARYTSDGIPTFVTNLNSTFYLDVLDIAPVPDFGGLYVLTDFSDTLYTGKDALFTSTQKYTGSLFYLNPNGFSEVLSVPYSSDGYALSGVTAASDGDYYVSGFMEDEDINVGGIDVLNQGCFDGMLAKGNLATQVEWARGVGSTGCEVILGGYYGKAMGLNAAGDLFVSGAYIEGMNFDNVTQSGSGLVVAKLKTGTVATADPAIEQVGVWPNPGSGSFRLSLPEGWPAGPGWLSLRDAQGRQVYTQALNTPNAEVQAIGLAAGVYTLSVQCAERLAQARVVVVQQANR